MFEEEDQLENKFDWRKFAQVQRLGGIFFGKLGFLQCDVIFYREFREGQVRDRNFWDWIGLDRIG